MLPQLYRPTPNEITSVVTSAKGRHPELATRLDKAAEIILSGGLQLDAVAWERGQLARWRVASQSGKGAYVVTSDHCPCGDSRCNGVSYCKHSIAAHLYMKVLCNRVNVTIRNRDIDLGILEDSSFHAYAKGLGIVHMKKVGTAYAFVDAASAVRFSMWLAAQTPVTIYIGDTAMEVYA